jgi:hypothetical protein
MSGYKGKMLALGQCHVWQRIEAALNSTISRQAICAQKIIGEVDR